MKTYNSVFVALFVSDVLFCAGPPALAASGDIKEAGSAVLIGLSVTCAASTLARGDGEGARQIGGAMAVTLALTAALKYAVNEKRPNWEDHSFPSGHSSVAFSMAEFTRARYGWAEGGLAYGAASFVACSRVLSKQHYLHDVVAGALLGAMSAYLLTTPYKSWKAGIRSDWHTLLASLERSW
ncbi:MAG: phosphatase PAP2 family protein [Candidatus Oleimicrobiaceae bacterium]